jgi:hypothetical protein
MRKMNQTPSSVPEYVDTTTPKWKWYTYHLLIAVFSLAMALIAAMIVEYELAHLRNPEASFIQTPTPVDLTLSIAIILIAVCNLSVLIFVFLRHLWLRKWMLATTILGWMLMAALVLVLQGNFLPVLLPSYRERTAPVAQWIEQLRSKETVGGSSPSGGAN